MKKGKFRLEKWFLGDGWRQTLVVDSNHCEMLVHFNVLTSEHYFTVKAFDDEREFKFGNIDLAIVKFNSFFK